ncbi:MULTISPECIES: acyl-homoserine-lactone synthase [Pseudomonas]|uniref:Acyl-homoserine-lactone synthase n=1 Tax=Pseudomonas chlororaphis TaxID=587753 RepID=A0AB34BYK9_9PSED|nr:MULTISPECIES: acyl-homoserine-lactone synthase [Pseudomonas]AUG04221.1 acyl-homoserine-lactone synthase [Pseudomonas sp. 09C 129]AZD04424.1 Autoinducer synthesis protein phzI [Pseudomonas chlororaphis subsp. chlororaphis]KAA5838626.1 GNAT family N-acetyltransferase [Pseudomonas chlororaphis]MBM0281508.1 GNAT family N-acetyltransferase [Pseudomonas chlororaphis]MDO1502748.1 GNAT family N-acetyltransferase [Pseudomonas chlororaphis]
MHMEEHTLNEMSDELKLMLGRFRHEQFVEKLGWRLPAHPSQAGCEWDQYDTEHARYLLAFNEDRAIVGCARLIPTTFPNLLEGVFGHTCAGAPPKHPAIWEMTRFTTREPQLAMPLFWRSLKTASLAGADAIVGIVNSTMERYYKINGVHYERLGPVTVHQNEKILAIKLSAHREHHRSAVAPSAFMSDTLLRETA